MANTMVTMTINGNTVTIPSEMATAYLTMVTGITPKGTVNTPTIMPEDVKTRKPSTFNASDFPEIGDDKAYVLGCSKVYPSHKMVRHFEGEFRPKKVRYAVKMSLIDGGATWNAEQKAYEFHTKKDFDAWVKAQKSRTKESK